MGKPSKTKQRERNQVLKTDIPRTIARTTKGLSQIGTSHSNHLGTDRSLA